MSRDLEEDELGLDQEALGSLEALEPPRDFVDKVMNARASQSRPSQEGRRPVSSKLPVIAVGALAAAALVAAVWLTVSESRAASGALVAEERETVALGDRGVAVAEAGSELEWTVARDGTARINQKKGKVFYRVERGEPFIVSTPTAEARVKGTSFHVEVIPMGKTKHILAGAMVGAALSASVIVTVYEGRVALANDEGVTEINAGEVAYAAGNDEAPSEAVDVAQAQKATSDEEIAAHRTQELMDESADEELSPEQLRERLTALRDAHQRQLNRNEELGRRMRELENGSMSADDVPFYPPSQDHLRSLVEQCGVRLDEPPLMGIQPGRVGERGEEMGMNEEEREAINGAITKLHQTFRDRLRPLYVEATGDEAGADVLSSRAMFAEINATSLRGEPGDLMKQLSRERAGLEPPPEDLSNASPLERALRMRAGMGDDFQELLSQELGAARAAELRAASGGWPWSRSEFHGCRRSN